MRRIPIRVPGLEMYTVIKRGRNQPSISTAFSIHLAELYEPLAALSFFAGDGNFLFGKGEIR
jgi:hypothetical protein